MPNRRDGTAPGHAVESAPNFARKNPGCLGPIPASNRSTGAGLVVVAQRCFALRQLSLRLRHQLLAGLRFYCATLLREQLFPSSRNRSVLLVATAALCRRVAFDLHNRFACSSAELLVDE